MLKFILLLIALWMAVRLVGRLVRFTTFIGGNQDDRQSDRPQNFSSSRRRQAVEEAEFEVLDSRIKQKE